jgi:hypothetical protein
MRRLVVVFVFAAFCITLSAQTAIPTREGRGGQAAQGAGPGRRGGGPPAPEINLPANPVAAPLPTISAEVTGPGRIFESLMELKPGDDMTHFKYEAHEYFVSGTANGQPYTTRIVIRRPTDASKFSGLVLAESMHPSGNAWMFHFTHAYTMSTGHIGLDILTSTSVPFAEFNAGRYKSLSVGQGQAPEILAQVGALMKSNQPGNPLASLPGRHVCVGGGAHQLPAGTHGSASIGHETDLRRLLADEYRRDDSPDRRADDPGAHDDRGHGRDSDDAPGR